MPDADTGKMTSVSELYFLGLGGTDDVGPAAPCTRYPVVPMTGRVRSAAENCCTTADTTGGVPCADAYTARTFTL